MTNFSTLFSPVSVTIANISELNVNYQTLAFDENNQNLSISNGNTVSLSGLAGTGREDVNTLVVENSGNWNTAYDTATAYSSVSSSFATNTTLESVSSLLTPLSLTNTLTSQLTLSSDPRLSDARTPTTHASSHATGGSDAIAPSDIGAQSLFSNSSIDLQSATTTLSAGRAVKLLARNLYADGANIVLPTTGNNNGDIFVITNDPSGSYNTINIQRFQPGPNINVTIKTAKEGETYRFIAVGGSAWQLVPVDTHTHAASDITSGTLTHERGGLEADVSAYDGLLKISGGSTSAVTVTTAGEALLDDADAAAQRVTLELGTAAQMSSADFVSTTEYQNASGNWEEAYNIGTAYQAISSTFLTSETDSQTLTFTESSAELSISNGNTVSLTGIVGNEGVNTLVIENSGSWFNTFWQFTSASTGYQLSAFYPKTLVSTLCSTVLITLPEIPNNGEEYTFKDCFNTWNSNNFLLSSNYPIDGFTEVLSANVQGGVFTVIFVDIDTGWTII